MIPFLPESWFPKKRNIDFHTPDRWWISPRIIQQRASTCFIIYQEPFVYKDFQHFHTKQYFVWLRLFSFICHKNCHKRATPNKGNGSDYYITFSSFFISFCTLAASTWLYMFIVMLMSLCPMIICKTLISIAILLINANSKCAEPPFAIVRTYCF